MAVLGARRTIHWKTLALVALAVISVATAVSCSSGGSQNPTATQSASVQPTSTPMSATPTSSNAAAPTATVTTAAPQATASNSAPVTRSQTLILMFGGPNQYTSPQEANPYAVGANQTACKCLYGDQLFYYNLIGTQADTRQVDWLGTSWSADDSSFTKFTVHIRKGVEWSDGVPFTAKDVAFTYKLLRDNPKLTGWGGAQDAPYWIKDAVASDDYTVHITLNHPNPEFQVTYLWAHQGFAPFIVPEHIWSQAKDPTTFTNFDISKGWPVTTGPYTLVESTPQRQVWKRRDNWWAAKTGFHKLPAPAEMVMVPASSQSQELAMILNGQIDAAPDTTVQTFETAIQKDTGQLSFYNGKNKPYGSLDWWTTALEFNEGKAPFDNVDFRNAIAHTLNRPQIIDVGMDGAGILANLPMAPFKPLIPYINAVQDEIKQSAESDFDLSKATSLMQGLGYQKDSSGFWAKNGQEVKFTIQAGNDSMSDIGPIIATQLRKGGFNVDYKLNSNLSTDFALGKADAWLYGPQGGSTVSPTRWLQLYNDKYTAPIGQRATYATARWGNAQFSQIAEQMRQMAPSTDASSKYMQLWKQAAAIYLKELPSIPIRQWQQRNIFNTTYWCGWSNTSDAPGVFWSQGQDTWWPRHTLMEILRVKPASECK